jgi:hypothetical protein
LNAQFIKKFDIEISHGWMKNYNKGNIQSESINSGLSGIHSQILNVDPLWTKMRSISIGYSIAKTHRISMKYSKGTVGSSLTGSIITYDDIGSSPAFTLENTPNIIAYRSWGLLYSFYLPIDTDNLIFELGVHRQQNSFDDHIIYIPGIYITNYNLTGSVGFAHSILSNIELVPKITVINSFSNKRSSESQIESRFVPLQIGFELGLRFKV